MRRSFAVIRATGIALGWWLSLVLLTVLAHLAVRVVLLVWAHT